MNSSPPPPPPKICPKIMQRQRRETLTPTAQSTRSAWKGRWGARISPPSAFPNPPTSGSKRGTSRYACSSHTGVWRGTGPHAVKMLLAGADRGFLLTPMMGEARYALRLTEVFGVRDRFAPVVGLGERIPFKAGFFDFAFSFVCFRHMRLEYVAGELRRALTQGVKFASAAPWNTSLHTTGAKTLGKHEGSVYCRPIAEERLAALQRWFRYMKVSRHTAASVSPPRVAKVGHGFFAASPADHDEHHARRRFSVLPHPSERRRHCHSGHEVGTFAHPIFGVAIPAPPQGFVEGLSMRENLRDTLV